MFNYIRDSIVESICNTGLFDDSDVRTYVDVSISQDLSKGDVCIKMFRLCKAVKKPINSVVNEVISLINLPKYITLYQIDRGYINCTLNRTELKKLVLSHVSSNKARMHENKGRAIVEHTSITPHATPHIGHGRNAVLGDTLARLLSFYGYDVQTHYFVNDLARQLAMLTMLCEYKTPPSFQQLTNQYAKLSPLLKRDKSFQKLVRDYCYKLELGEHSAKKTLQNILEIRLSGIKKHFQAINIQYDNFVYESRFINLEWLESLLRNITEKDEAGRTVLKLSRKSKAQTDDVVLKRSNSSSLYIYRELGYQILKSQMLSESDLSLSVLGENQRQHFQKTSEILDFLGYKPSEGVFYAMIKNEKGTMSTKKNNKFLLHDLFTDLTIKITHTILQKRPVLKSSAEISAKKIATGIIRFNLLNTKPSNDSIFDIDQYTNNYKKGYFYILNTYFRIKELSAITIKVPKNKYISNTEWEIYMKLAAFTEKVEKATLQRNPAILTRYLSDISAYFNRYCGGEASAIHLAKSKKLSYDLCLCTSYILKQGLDILGIELPDFV